MMFPRGQASPATAGLSLVETAGAGGRGCEGMCGAGLGSQCRVQLWPGVPGLGWAGWCLGQASVLPLRSSVLAAVQ